MSLAVDIQIASARWSPEAPATVRRAIAAAASCHRLGAARREVSVVLTDDASMRALNQKWRGIDEPTNVLSFPGQVSAQPAATRSQTGAKTGASVPRDPARLPVLLGDIVIAYETTQGEAADAGKPFAHHLAHLAVHGFLHLLGYDHDSDPEAEDMEHLETEILAHLGVPDPYLTRAR